MNYARLVFSAAVNESITKWRIEEATRQNKMETEH